MLVRHRLNQIALEKGLRQTTVLSYERLLGRVGLLDRNLDDVTQSDTFELIWTIDNPNSRRATVIAIRSVFGFGIRIPKGIPEHVPGLVELG